MSWRMKMQSGSSAIGLVYKILIYCLLNLLYFYLSIYFVHILVNFKYMMFCNWCLLYPRATFTIQAQVPDDLNLLQQSSWRSSDVCSLCTATALSMDRYSEFSLQLVRESSVCVTEQCQRPPIEEGVLYVFTERDEGLQVLEETLEFYGAVIEVLPCNVLLAWGVFLQMITVPDPLQPSPLGGNVPRDFSWLPRSDFPS